MITQHDKLYEVGVGFTSKLYDYVLTSFGDNTHRIGYRLVAGVWEQYQENYGSCGEWTKRISSKIQDRYIAYHYEAQLKNEGFKVTVTEMIDGTLEMEAEEATW